MAKTFGSYSSPISTTTHGQGIAQVFAPNAIPLDAGALSAGISNAGHGIAQGMYYSDEQKKREALKKKEERAARDKRIQETLNGKYTYFTEAKRYNADLVIDNMLSGKIPENEWDAAITGLEYQNGLITQTENMVGDIYKTSLGANDKRMVFRDDTGEWVPMKTWMTEKLSSPLMEEDQEMLNKGLFSQYAVNEFEKPVLNHNPEFSLREEALNSFSKWGGASDDTKAYIQSLGPNYDAKVVVSQMSDEELDRFYRHLKNNPSLMGRWFEQEAIREGVPPQLLADQQFLQSAHNVYGRQIEGIELPRRRKEDISIVERDNGGSGAGGVKFSVTYGAGGAKTLDDKTVVSEASLALGDADVMGERVVSLIGRGDDQGVVIMKRDEKGEFLYSESGVPQTQIVKDKALAEAYKNQRLSSMGETEKGAAQAAITELNNSKTLKIDADMEYKTVSDSLSERMHGYSGDYSKWYAWANDDEDKFIAAMNKEGFALSDNLKAMINEADFTDESARKEVVKEIIKENPWVVIEKAPTTSTQPFDPTNF